MNAAQTKYLMARIADILKVRKEVLKAEYVIPAIKLTLPQKWMLVVDGEVPLDTASFPRDCNPSGYKDWYEVFDFSRHEEAESIKGGYETALAELEAEAKSIQDRIMLGDAMEAVALLDKFAAGSTA